MSGVHPVPVSPLKTSHPLNPFIPISSRVHVGHGGPASLQRLVAPSELLPEASTKYVAGDSNTNLQGRGRGMSASCPPVKGKANVYRDKGPVAEPERTLSSADSRGAVGSVNGLCHPREGAEGHVERSVTGAYRDFSSGSHAKHHIDTSGASHLSMKQLSVSILGMSPLHANPFVVRPFVRVWLVDGISGRSLTTMKLAHTPCCVTHPVDIRFRHTRAPWWDAEVLFPVAPFVMEDSSLEPLLLFEVLDDASEKIDGFPLRHKDFYRICWGFLRLRGTKGKPIFGKRLNIQMFPFPERVSFFTRILQSLPSFFLRPYGGSEDAYGNHPQIAKKPDCNVKHVTDDMGSPSEPPDIYYTYRNASSRKVPYTATLLISLLSISNPAYVPKEASILPSEEDFFEKMSVSHEQRPISSRRTVSVPPSTPGRSDCVESCSCYTMRGSCYLRNGEERVLFSTTVLQRIQVAGSVTCMAFSSDESLIAVAVTYGAEHVVQLRYALMCGGPITGLCRGHAGHIHSVRFHENNQLLLTCSSDKMAKVWRRDGLFFAGNAHGPVDISCVCTLQHGFPLYGGVFFNGAIVTCGFDPRLFVWRYGGLDSSWTQSPGRDEVTARESNSIKEARCSSLGQVASTTLDASVEPRHYQGKVMQRAAGEAGGVFYSLSTQGYEYLWSVDSSGNVFIWSLSKQTARMDEDLPQIEVYRRYTCPGGTKVEVSGCTALVTCAKSPFAYVFDVIDHQLTHQVRVHQLPYPHAITLLPDGEAFVAPTADGHLQYWDSPCGSLCASPRDNDGVKVDMVTQGIVWSPILQIGVLVGSKGRMNAAGKKSHCPSTFLTVVGAPRDEKDMLRQSSLGVSSRFRSCCSGRGGSVDEVPDSTGVSVRCSPNTCSLSPSTRFSATEPSSATEGKASLMEEIIDTWRQLTCLHRRSKKGELMSTLDSATEVYVEENI